MTGKVCNVARNINELLATSRKTDEEFMFMPLGDIGTTICHTSYVPNTKEGRNGYCHHALKFNNNNGSMRIMTQVFINQLKPPGA
jgi:hypothetical protein